MRSKCFSPAILIVLLLSINFCSCTENISPKRPAEFIVDKVTVFPLEAAPFENITITAYIKNVGEMADNYTSILCIDGKERERKTIFIEQSENESINFSIFETDPGLHNVTIGSSSENFSIYELENLVLRHDNGICSYSYCYYDPRGQWIKFNPPSLPFQINKIYIAGKRTRLNDEESKFYTIKIYNRFLGPELYSSDFPWTNFTTDFSIVEHTIDPAIIVSDNFFIDFISHSKNLSSAIFTCVDFTVDSNEYIGASYNGTNNQIQKTDDIYNDPRWAKASWMIQVEGNCRKNMEIPLDYETAHRNSMKAEGWVFYPQKNVEWKINEFFYYIGTPRKTCQQLGVIKNTDTQLIMTDITINDTLIVDSLAPGEQFIYAKEIPCRNAELRWKWKSAKP